MATDESHLVALQIEKAKVKELEKEIAHLRKLLGYAEQAIQGEYRLRVNGACSDGK